MRLEDSFGITVLTFLKICKQKKLQLRQKAFNIYSSLLAARSEITSPLKQEYLQSNFDPEILKDLAAAGADVSLLKEYTDQYRSYVSSLLSINKEKQEQQLEVSELI